MYLYAKQSSARNRPVPYLLQLYISRTRRQVGVAQKSLKTSLLTDKIFSLFLASVHSSRRGARLNHLLDRSSSLSKTVFSQSGCFLASSGRFSGAFRVTKTRITDIDLHQRNDTLICHLHRFCVLFLSEDYVTQTIIIISNHFVLLQCRIPHGLLHVVAVQFLEAPVSSLHTVSLSLHPQFNMGQSAEV